MIQRFQQLSALESNGREYDYVLLERIEHITDEPLEQWAERLLLEGGYTKGLYIAERGHTSDEWTGVDFEASVELVACGSGSVTVLP